MTPDWQSEDGAIQLYCGDCLDVLPHLSGIDAVITDPPYGMNLDARYANSTPNLKKGIGASRGYENVIGDDKPFDPLPIIGICDEVFLWGADYFAAKLPNGGSWLAWDKREGIEQVEYSASEFELCWSKQKHLRRILRQRWFGLCGTETQDVRSRIHPTQKPWQLMAKIILLIKCETIADPYMGSGSTAIACIRHGKRFIGCEIDKTIFQIAKERIERELQQGILL